MVHTVDPVDIVDVARHHLEQSESSRYLDSHKSTRIFLFCVRRNNTALEQKQVPDDSGFISGGIDIELDSRPMSVAWNMEMESADSEVWPCRLCQSYFSQHDADHGIAMDSLRYAG